MADYDEKMMNARAAVLKAAMAYALLYKKPQWTTRKWVGRERRSQATLFARCVRLRRLEGGKP